MKSRTIAKLLIPSANFWATHLIMMITMISVAGCDNTLQFDGQEISREPGIATPVSSNISEISQTPPIDRDAIIQIADNTNHLDPITSGGMQPVDETVAVTSEEDRPTQGQIDSVQNPGIEDSSIPGSLDLLPAVNPDEEITETTVPATPTMLDNPTVAFGGRFLGSSFSGVTVGNSTIHRYQNGIRFQADASGHLDRVRYQNRTLLKRTVKRRCDQGHVDYCQCQHNGMGYYGSVDDMYKAVTPGSSAIAGACGWKISNSYMSGNGGLQTISLHPDDGTAAHMPNLNNELARTRAYVPADEYEDNGSLSSPFIDLQFDTPVSVNQGTLYHLIWTNANMPPLPSDTREDIIRNKSVETAQEWGMNYGAIGFNGWQYESSEKSTNPVYRYNLVYGRHDPSDTEFTIDPDNLPFYSVHYVNGGWMGDTNERTASVAFGAGAQVRQSFIVQRSDSDVDGLWVLLKKKSGSGDALAVLRDLSGIELTRAEIPSSSISTSGSIGSWVYVPLSKAASLKQGDRYFLTLSSAADTIIETRATYSMGDNPYNAKNDLNSWGGVSKTNDFAYAERSTNGGDDWSKFGNGSYPGKDLSVLFTIVGGPRYSIIE